MRSPLLLAKLLFEVRREERSLLLFRVGVVTRELRTGERALRIGDRGEVAHPASSAQPLWDAVTCAARRRGG